MSTSVKLATHCRTCGCTPENPCVDAQGSPCGQPHGATVCSRCWHGDTPRWVPRSPEQWRRAVEKAAAYFGEIRFECRTLDEVIDQVAYVADLLTETIHDEILERGSVLGYHPRPTAMVGGGPLP